MPCPLLITEKSRQTGWFKHVMGWTGSLAETKLQGGTDGFRPVRPWLNNVRDWTGLNLCQLLRTADDREHW